MSECTVVLPGGGTTYDWSADRTSVKVGAELTGSSYTLMEDNLKPGFALGLHRHDHHSETFYVLEGPIDFPAVASDRLHGPSFATATRVTYHDVLRGIP